MNEENLKKVLTASGLDVDEARVKSLTAAISEVKIEDAIKAAPVGFAAPAAPAAAAAEAPAAEAAKPGEKKKKEAKEAKKKEEEAMAGLGALFG